VDDPSALVADSQPGLYVVYLGGNLTPGRMGEDHEVVLVVADSTKSARTLAKRKWQGTGRAHVDAVQRIDVLDGHRVSVVATGEPDVVPIDDTYSP
jgi:hypothetical protein